MVKITILPKTRSVLILSSWAKGKQSNQFEFFYLFCDFKCMLRYQFLWKWCYQSIISIQMIYHTWFIISSFWFLNIFIETVGIGWNLQMSYFRMHIIQYIYAEESWKSEHTIYTMDVFFSWMNRWLEYHNCWVTIYYITHVHTICFVP